MVWWGEGALVCVCVFADAIYSGLLMLVERLVHDWRLKVAKQAWSPKKPHPGQGLFTKPNHNRYICRPGEKERESGKCCCADKHTVYS